MEPGWFDRAKLASLGFDCRLTAEDPEAPAHYGWQPAREVWVVLELDGDSFRGWLEDREKERDAALRKAVGREGASAAARRVMEAFEKDRTSRSRLFTVDAGLDASALRLRYPDRGKFLIVRAIVTASSFRSWDPETRTSGAPFIRGVVESLLVERIQVPREKRAILDALAAGDRDETRKRTAGAARATTGSDSPPGREPRFRVRLCFGRRHEPWVAAVW
jgi:hypothetical protein